MTGLRDTGKPALTTLRIRPVGCAPDGHRRDKNPVHFPETSVMQVVQRWARLGSNQRYARNACGERRLVSRSLAGQTRSARLAPRSVSSARLDYSDGHQRDTPDPLAVSGMASGLAPTSVQGVRSIHAAPSQQTGYLPCLPGVASDFVTPGFVG